MGVACREEGLSQDIFYKEWNWWDLESVRAALPTKNMMKDKAHSHLTDTIQGLHTSLLKNWRSLSRNKQNMQRELCWLVHGPAAPLGEARLLLHAGTRASMTFHWMKALVLPSTLVVRLEMMWLPASSGEAKHGSERWASEMLPARNSMDCTSFLTSLPRHWTLSHISLSRSSDLFHLL